MRSLSRFLNRPARIRTASVSTLTSVSLVSSRMALTCRNAEDGALVREAENPPLHEGDIGLKFLCLHTARSRDSTLFRGWTDQLRIPIVLIICASAF